MASMEIDGHALHYAQSGEGQPGIVFVHGFSCSHEDWSAQTDYFSASHHVVALDQRGHGASSAFEAGFDIETYGADVAALVESLNIAPAVLVGHSLGCRSILEAASERPDLVAGLVLVDGSRSAEGDREAAEFNSREVVEQFGGIRALASSLFESMFLPTSDPTAKSGIIERALKVPEHVASTLWTSMQGYDAAVMEASLSGLECPVLLIQSTDRSPDHSGRRVLQAGDSTSWTKLAERVAPDVEVQIVPGVGHFTMIEAPAKTNALIEAFIARLGA